MFKSLEQMIQKIRNGKEPENFDFKKEKKEKKKDPLKIEKITEQEIRPEIPEIGGTTFVLQRNAKDNRKDPQAPDYGALDTEAAEQTRNDAEKFFNEIFSKLKENERKSVDILVVASDATLTTDKGHKSPHKRAVETAEQVMAGLKKSMEKFSVFKKQLLNNSASAQGGPIEMSGLKDMRALEDSPEFVKFLSEKWGDRFWPVFEDDTEKETRIKMGAEGPLEIANRMNYFIKAIANTVKIYHEENPGRRVIVWAVSHYDSISPYIKEHVVKTDTLKTYLPVEQGGGITIAIDKDGKAKTKIKNEEYLID